MAIPFEIPRWGQNEKYIADPLPYFLLPTVMHIFFHGDPPPPTHNFAVYDNQPKELGELCYSYGLS